MKVVCYMSTLSDGGAERVMSVLANCLARRGHDVTLVVSYTKPGEYALDASVERVVLDEKNISYASKGRIKRIWNRLSKLRSICKQKNADILISFLSNINIGAILSTRFIKTKNLISVRSDPKVAYSGKNIAALVKLFYPIAEGCVFQTEEAKQWFSKKIQRKSRIILNPIADAFYDVTPAAMQEKRIVTCGRLDEQKRFDLLIDAFDKICDAFPDYKLEIYGQGYLRKALQAQIDKLGREDRICLMGRCNDVPNTIKDASLFVLSSDYEGLPNALMEAMVLSLPVISTDCGGGGARALIENGVDGLIVPCGDVDALANAMRESLSNPAAAKRRGEKAGEKAKTFSTENVVTQWETYITQIVQRKHGPRNGKTKEN